MERRQTAKVTEALARLNAYLDEHEAAGTAPKSLSLAARTSGIAYSSLMNSSGYASARERGGIMIEEYKKRVEEASALRIQEARKEALGQREAIFAAMEYFREAGIKPRSLRAIARHAGVEHTAPFYTAGNEDLRRAAREICPAREKPKAELEPVEEPPEGVLLARQKERWGDCLSTRGGIEAFPLVRAH